MRLPKVFTSYLVEHGYVRLHQLEDVGSVFVVQDDDPALDDLFMEADLCSSNSQSCAVDQALAPHAIMSARHTLEAMLRQGYRPGKAPRTRVLIPGCTEALSAAKCTQHLTQPQQQEIQAMPETVLNPPNFVDAEDQAPAPKKKATAKKKAASKTVAAKPEAAAKPAKEKAAKPPKAERERNHGVTRPNPTSQTGLVWVVADELSTAAGRPATRSEVCEEAMKRGVNGSTATTQYGRWRRFWGIKGRVTAPEPATPAAEDLDAQDAEATTH